MLTSKDDGLRRAEEYISSGRWQEAVTALDQVQLIETSIPDIYHAWVMADILSLKDACVAMQQQNASPRYALRVQHGKDLSPFDEYSSNTWSQHFVENGGCLIRTSAEPVEFVQSLKTPEEIVAESRASGHHWVEIISKSPNKTSEQQTLAQMTRRFDIL